MPPPVDACRNWNDDVVSPSNLNLACNTIPNGMYCGDMDQYPLADGSGMPPPFACADGFEFSKFVWCPS